MKINPFVNEHATPACHCYSIQNSFEWKIMQALQALQTYRFAKLFPNEFLTTQEIYYFILLSQQ